MKYFFLALSLLVFLAACDKKPTVVPNRENMMRAKKWKITGGTMTVKQPGGRDTILKYMDFLDTCYLDDFIEFDSMHFGSLFMGNSRCNAADPASRGFTWRLWNNDKYIDLFDGFNTIFAVNTSIMPYRFDTLEKSPLKLDTIVGRLDTIPGFIKQFIILDTVRELRYKAYPIPNFDIYGAEISEFTESSFKLNFSFKTKRLDSTNFRAGDPNNFPPVELPDTSDYSIIYSAF
jgi:hypothetical protein